MQDHADFKEVVIKERKFTIRKFNARTGAFMAVKVAGIIAPMFNGIDLNKIKAKDVENFDLNSIDIPSVISGITSLPEPDFNYIYDKCLQVCSESLPAGPTKVMNPDGSFGVIGLETDSATTLALVAHALIFNVKSFFSGSPLASILGALPTLNSFIART